MNRSDMWRGVSFADRAKEVAHVTHGISDYFGTVAEDRSYKVTWKPLSGLARTFVNEKRVELSSALLDGQSCPFTGQFVDDLMGYAAHEAGHTQLVPAIDYNNRSWGSACRNPLWGSISNIVQDLAIDGRPMKEWNPGFGELTAAMRRNMAAEQRIAIEAQWRSLDGLDAQGLVNLWGCALLVDAVDVLKDIPGRETEFQTVQKLNPLGLKVKDSAYPVALVALKGLNSRNIVLGGLITDVCGEILTVLSTYTQPSLPMPPSGPPSKGSKGAKAPKAPKPDDEELDEAADEPNEDSSEEESDEEDGDSSPEGEDEEDSPDESDGSAEDGSEADEDDDGSEGADGDDDGDGEGEAAPGSEGAGAGTPSKVPVIVICPAPKGTNKPTALSPEEQQFWEEVLKELERLEVESLLDRGVSRREAKDLLGYLIDDGIVKQVEQTYRKLSSDPSRKRRVTQGRIDRRNVILAGSRSDIFNTKQQSRLDGTLALVLDLSGSTALVQELIKQAAASVYVALAKTDVDTYIYTYGNPIVARLASPTVLGDFTTVHSSGGTPSGNALGTVIEEVRPKGRSIILHVTDGDADDQHLYEAAFAKAEKEGWSILTIIVGSGAGQTYVARLSKAHGFPEPKALASYDELPGVLDEVIEGLLREAKR